jgi:hypothetical protein
MNGYVLNILLNHSISIAAIVAMIRFKSIAENFYPFIFFIWTGFINETLSLILIFTIHSNTVNSNVYVLIEYALILLQFYKWNGCLNRRYYFLSVAGLIIWITDNFIIHSITDNNSIFRIYYSFVIVLFSIDQINKLIIYERKSLLKNSTFLICTAFLIYYSCKAFVEVFNAFDLGLSNELERNIFMILYLANLLSNLIYPIAIVCIPTNREFILLY